MQFINRLILVFLLFFLFDFIYSQQSGMPFIRNFQPVEYRAGRQNWSIAQDSRGIMYFGNNEGVLEYDGVSWQLTKLSGVKSVAIDSVGRIWVGMETDMGYLEPDEAGVLRYSSINSELPESYREHSTVLHICILGRKIVFQTSDELIIYEKGDVHVISSEMGFQNMFVVFNRLYVRERERGLPSEYALPVKLESGELVFSTRRGIFKYQNEKNRFESHPDFEMLKGNILSFVQLGNGDIWFNEYAWNYFARRNR